MLKALLLIINGQYNRKILKDQLEDHLPDHLHPVTCSFFYHWDQAVLSIKTFSKTTLEF